MSLFQLGEPRFEEFVVSIEVSNNRGVVAVLPCIGEGLDSASDVGEIVSEVFANEDVVKLLGNSVPINRAILVCPEVTAFAPKSHPSAYVRTPMRVRQNLDFDTFRLAKHSYSFYLLFRLGHAQFAYCPNFTNLAAIFFWVCNEDAFLESIRCSNCSHLGIFECFRRNINCNSLSCIQVMDVARLNIKAFATTCICIDLKLEVE